MLFPLKCIFSSDFNVNIFCVGIIINPVARERRLSGSTILGHSPLSSTAATATAVDKEESLSSCSSPTERRREEGEVTSSLDHDPTIGEVSSSTNAFAGFYSGKSWMVMAVVVVMALVTAVAVKACVEAAEAAAAEAAAREAAAAAAAAAEAVVNVVEEAVIAVQLVMALVGAFEWVLRVAW